MKLYEYILEYFEQHKFVPTVRVISNNFFCSTSTVQKRLKELESSGDIIRKMDGSTYRLKNEVILDLITKEKQCTDCGQCNCGQCVMYEE